MGGIGRIVAADVGEGGDPVLPQEGEGTIEIAFPQLVATGAEGGRRRAPKGGEGIRWQVLELEEVLIEQPFDAVPGAEHPPELAGVAGSLDHAGEAGIDDGGCPAGLPDKQGGRVVCVVMREASLSLDAANAGEVYSSEAGDLLRRGGI